MACATVILYGNFPGQQIIGCEKQGGPESVCVAAEWDSEKVDLLLARDPEARQLIIVQKNASAVEAGSFKS